MGTTYTPPMAGSDVARQIAFERGDEVEAGAVSPDQWHAGTFGPQPASGSFFEPTTLTVDTPAATFAEIVDGNKVAFTAVGTYSITMLLSLAFDQSASLRGAQPQLDFVGQSDIITTGSLIIPATNQGITTGFTVVTQVVADPADLVTYVNQVVVDDPLVPNVAWPPLVLANVTGRQDIYIQQLWTPAAA